MKNAIPLAAFLICLLGCSPTGHLNTQPPETTILWTPENVTWNDFKEPPPADANESAKTHWRFEHRYVVVSPDTLRFFIAMWFISERSWVKKGATGNAFLLKHEQYHFNLAELYARKLKRYLSVSTFPASGYQPQLASLFNEYADRLHDEQAQYDAESNHGMDKDGQYRWIHSIDTRLEQLSAYADTTITIKLQSRL
jgi:hypothetical protein